MTSPFTRGAGDAGEAAGRALFESFRREWSVVVTELDILIEGRAAMRGVGAQTLALAQEAAREGLSAEFDRLFDEWASMPPEPANEQAPRSDALPAGEAVAE